ncbi:MAG: diacylglycerol/lipid kinase family protein [Anaerolineales bacterium]
MMSRKTKLIFNPHADRGHAWDVVYGLRGLIERYDDVSWAATDYPGHATKLAAEAMAEGYQVIAGLGGDGTVHEIINALMKMPVEERPLLAAVPVGSGNDFCANNGIPKDPEQALLRVFDGEPHVIDLASIRDNNNHRKYWGNTISIGFGASVAIYAYHITNLRGFPMYLWAVTKTIFLQHNAPIMRIETDQESFEDEVLMISLNNGAREGGGFLTSPDAEPDDGILNYALINNVSRAMMFRLIPEVMRGTHGRFKDVRLGAFTKMKISSQEPIPIHADGEIYADFSSQVTELEIEILPEELTILR